MRKITAFLLSYFLAFNAFATGVEGPVNGASAPNVANATGTLPIANGGTNVTSATDDSLLVGNGTTFQLKAVATCTDTGGNHLNYDASTNTFSCGTSGSGGTAAGSDKQIQFNDGGTSFGGDADHTWDKTTNTETVGSTATPGIIKGADGSAANGAALSLQGGLAGVSNTGGAISITAGAGGATSGDGGVASTIGGSATTSGVGGQARLLGGAALGANNSGGNAVVTGGASVGSGAGANVTITGGLSNATNGTGQGGTVTVIGGAGGGTSGAGGNVQVRGGVAATSGAGGSVTIEGRGATGTAQNGGSVLIIAGAQTGAGAPGTISLQVASGTTKVQVDGVGNLIYKQAEASQGYSVQVPTTGFTITIADNVSDLILNPAGTLATGTITMPANPIDGQKIRISSSQVQTALTLSPNSGQSIKNAPTALAAAGVGVGYIYQLSATTWFRQY